MAKDSIGAIRSEQRSGVHEWDGILPLPRNLLDLALRRSDEQPDLSTNALTEVAASLDAMLQFVTQLLDANAADHAPLARPAPKGLCIHVAAAARRNAPCAGR